ncbi:hypothetical protein CC86DRAFT_375280 [Ophiobolus disseminans]|uniref:Myb-like domain-containing protein n=1 Tax=Ophiobolus disseminans TaxID=1469910 RepID=A0A6A6ZDA5_9PLEO|nr:hypothetical protein CC86DRAFT_375280 [Ophiobolus disseminans]
MSAEEGSSQPPAAGNDKTQAPKAAATFSSFINKNTTGKKFAPKAARRRPGAVPAAKPPASVPEPAPAPPVEAQPTPAESESSIAPEEPAPAVQLPTPNATQDPGTRDVPQTTPTSTEVATEAPVSNTVQDAPLPTPPSTVPEVQVNSETSTTVTATKPDQVDHDEADTGRASKRRRMDPPPPKSPALTTTVVDTYTDTPAEVEADTNTQSQQEIAVNSEVEQAGEIITEQPEPEDTAAPRPRKRRTLPWNAVNRPQEEEEEDTPVPAKKARKPPKSRGKKKAPAVDETQETQEVEQEADAEGGEVPPVRKRPSTKARGKRRADAPPLENGEEAPAPAKRARRPRKVKSKATIVDSDAEDGGAEEQADEEQELVARRKPRKPRQKKRTAPEGEVEDGEDGSQPKRKGRPPREPTPSDAEDNEIDPEITFMDNLASQNIRVGKLSTRERKMREIDWVAVRQRQREEDLRPMPSREEREKAEQLRNEQQPQQDGVRFRVGAGGEIEIIHDSMTVNEGADAERNFEQMVVLEEADLTTRITSRSFLKNNKRFPNDFVLPGQGKRWSLDDTQRFYQGLRNFGTDFQMISHMFPGSSRRSIKLKFNREERDDPEAVQEALHGKSQIASQWDNFLEVSQIDEERFADTDRIKREMAEVEAKMRERIVAATAETKERKIQQREAGVLDDDVEGAEKENVKGKKKRKGKEKQVTFQEEAGVEIVGVIDDDADWGKE